MSKAIYISLILFFSLLIQILFGISYLIIPVASLSVFYLTIVFGWAEGFASAVVSGIVLDILYGRTFLISPLINIISTILALLWLHKGELKILSFQMLPAGVIGMFYILPLIYNTYQQTEHGIILALKNIGIIIVSLAITCAFLPCIIRFLDAVNVPLGFHLYRTSQEKLDKED
jgi:hypothetical protein